MKTDNTRGSGCVCQPDKHGETIERTTIRETEEITAAALASADPFELDHDCINPAGHQPVPSCGEVVCFHCARIIWS